MFAIVVSMSVNIISTLGNDGRTSTDGLMSAKLSLLVLPTYCL